MVMCYGPGFPRTIAPLLGVSPQLLGGERNLLFSQFYELFSQDFDILV
jgi:hypothetical protein